MSAFRTFLGVLVALSLCASTSAQPAPQTGRIPTVTRLVKIFSELETAIQARARSSDPAALESSLDSSFEMRDASTPGTPVPRDEWIRQTRSTAAQSRSIDQMAVHDLGAYALVSFRETETATSAGLRHERFIVDCWKRDGDAWKLAVRYASESGAWSTDKAPSGRKFEKRY
jgi:hypothetical protein